MNEKFLSLGWFKQSAEKAIEKVISNKLEQIIEEDNPVETGVPLFRNIKLINDVLVIVMNDGNILSKPQATHDDFEAVKSARNLEEIQLIISSQEVVNDVEERRKEIKRAQAIQKGIEALADLPDFVVEDNIVYLSGTSRSMPQLLVEKFIEIVERVKYYKGFSFTIDSLQEDEEYLAHKNFFMWCCLNPRAEVANELYRFLSENAFRITKQGFFVALRNVVTVHGSPELVHFVSNTYNKVKAVWKKNPNEYSVFLEEGNYKLVHNDKLYETKTITSTDCQECNGAGGWYNDTNDWDGEWEDCDVCSGTGEVDAYEYTETVTINHGQLIGNLTELYLDLPNREENRFTDNWTKTFDIRIGQVVSMPQEECDWSTQDCARAGLHFAGHTAPYVLCGDTTVFTLHNPMKVVGIGTEKGRCWEYLPFMLTNIEDANYIMNDGSFDFLQLDEQYAIRELESLVERAQQGFSVEAKKHQFNIPNISSDEINNIVLF